MNKIEENNNKSNLNDRMNINNFKIVGLFENDKMYKEQLDKFINRQKEIYDELQKQKKIK